MARFSEGSTQEMARCSEGSAQETDIKEELNEELFTDSDSEESEIEHHESDLVPKQETFVAHTLPTELPVMDCLGVTSNQLNWRCRKPSDKVTVYDFSGNVGLSSNVQPLELKQELDYFSLLFDSEVLRIVVDETNKYAEEISSIRAKLTDQKHSSSWKRTTTSEMQKFLGLVLLMGHIDKDNILQYWSTDELLETPIFGKTMAKDRFLLILRHLHFLDKAPNKHALYDQLWELREIFDSLNNNFKRVYDPTEEVAINKAGINFQICVKSRQCVPKEYRRWGLKLFKLTDKNCYTYDMKVYAENDCYEGVPLPTSHQIARDMADCLRNRGHKLFMDTFFSSTDLFQDLAENFKLNSFGTVDSNRNDFPEDIYLPKLQHGEIRVKCSKGMTAVGWKDQQEVYMLSNMHNRNEQTKEDVKLQFVAEYKKQSGFVALNSRMSNSYVFGKQMPLEWEKKFFFHLLNLAVLNSFILHRLSNNDSTHQIFRLKLIKQLISNSSTGND